ncbi:MAG: carboxypeptidase-like regulatory domain-containing protein [Bacteroidetes bacterium]|nr:MAG: carboxypeptidase-like regulatory domain-containing protein [Bacteroidota bacterium]
MRACPLRLLLSLTVLALASTAALAQPQPPTAALVGTVTDAETGEPLIGVNVFIANSMTGTATDAEGRYELTRVPVGALRLFVSMIGFEQVAIDTLLREPRVYTIDVQLRPEVLELGEVTVEAKGDPRWKERLERFTKLFIGETPNARETVIVNPEVLDFANRGGEFIALASEPLVIENRALGYRIRYFLREFKALPTRTQYDGEPLFEEMEAESPEQQAAWEARRREAFIGSFRHFLLALLAGQTEAQGFLTFSRPAADGTAASAGPLGGGNPVAGNQRFPLDPKTLLQPGASRAEYTLDFQGFVEVVFQGELEDEAYLEWIGEGRRRPRFQTSMIRLERGPTTVDYKGDVLDPYGVTLFRYWAFERVADEVPREYRPGR